MQLQLSLADLLPFANEEPSTSGLQELDDINQVIEEGKLVEAMTNILEECSRKLLQSQVARMRKGDGGGPASFQTKHPLPQSGPSPSASEGVDLGQTTSSQDTENGRFWDLDRQDGSLERQLSSFATLRLHQYELFLQSAVSRCSESLGIEVSHITFSNKAGIFTFPIYFLFVRWS